MATSCTNKDYIICKTLGRGSYGEVFLVRKKGERKQARIHFDFNHYDI